MKNTAKEGMTLENFNNQPKEVQDRIVLITKRLGVVAIFALMALDKEPENIKGIAKKRLGNFRRQAENYTDYIYESLDSFTKDNLVFMGQELEKEFGKFSFDDCLAFLVYAENMRERVGGKSRKAVGYEKYQFVTKSALLLSKTFNQVNFHKDDISNLYETLIKTIKFIDLSIKPKKS